jgi:hypothetical protein
MCGNPLDTLKSETVKGLISQMLTSRCLDDNKFESSISCLLAQAGPHVTREVTDEILLRYRLKIACDLTATNEEAFLTSVSKTSCSFGPIRKHLYAIRDSSSLADLNILDLSSLSTIFEQKQGKLIDLLRTFTNEKADFLQSARPEGRTTDTTEWVSITAIVRQFGNEIQRGRAPVHLKEAALHGSLRRIECDYGKSPLQAMRST